MRYNKPGYDWEEEVFVEETVCGARTVWVTSKIIFALWELAMKAKIEATSGISTEEE
jgi:hypothetical protein